MSSSGLGQLRGGSRITSDHEVDVDSYDSGSQSVKVVSPKGMFCVIQVKAKVDATPDECIDILTSPTSDKIFRNSSKTVRPAVRRYEGSKEIINQEQEGKWRLLMFSGKFTVHMETIIDHKDKTINFRLVTPGFMRVFEGEWHMLPFSQANLAKAVAMENDYVASKTRDQSLHVEFSPAAATHAGEGVRAGGGQPGEPHPLFAIRDRLRLPKVEPKMPALPSALANINVLDRLRRREEPTATLVTLRQTVQPSLVPPPPLDKWVRRITAKVVQEILIDLQTECSRRKTLREQGKEVPHRARPRG